MAEFQDYTRVIEMEMSGESYEFDLFGVFYDPDTKQYYTGTDSGCSCPEPWVDRFDPETDLKGPFTFTEALRELDKTAMEADRRDAGWFVDSAMARRAELIQHGKAEGTFPGGTGRDY